MRNGGFQGATENEDDYLSGNGGPRSMANCTLRNLLLRQWGHTGTEERLGARWLSDAFRASYPLKRMAPSKKDGRTAARPRF